MRDSHNESEAAFLAALPEIDAAARFVCRRKRCSAEDAEEFLAVARLHVIDHGYRVLRAYQGKSKPKTYFVVVFTRLHIDVQRGRLGVFRPSAEAKRSGPVGVRMDELLNRDGYTLEQAIEKLKADPRVTSTEDELRAVAARLPRRPRRREVGEDELPNLAEEPKGLDAALSDERGRRRAELRACLKKHLERLSDEDALALRLRYNRGVLMKTIAASLGVPAAPFYRRLDRVHQDLRKELEREGFSAFEVSKLLDDALSADDAEGEIP